MNLPSIFSKADQPQRKLLFAIHITEGIVQAVLWEVKENALETVVFSGYHTWQDEEGCVAAIDQSLQELGKESEDVKQTLFALNTDWVDNNGIAAHKKHLFQRITKELSLEAIGFVVTAEAVTQYLAQTTTPQLNLFLIEIHEQYLSVLFVKQGQVVQHERVGRSGESVSDLTEAFAHFKEKTFPPKILLFSSVLEKEETEETQQQLIGHDWIANYPFLHPPVVEVFPKEDLLRAVIYTGGKAAAEAKGFIQPGAASIPAEDSVAEETAVAPAEEKKKKVHDEGESNVEPVSASTFGVPVSDTFLAHQSKSHDDFSDIQTDFSPVKKKPAFSGFSKHSFSKNKVVKFMQSHVLFVIIGILGGLLTLFGMAFYVSANMSRADIAVKLNTKVVAKEVSLTLDPRIPQSDPSKLLLKAEVVTKEVSGSKTAEATGKKVIGDKSKGKVTLFNRTSSVKNFPAGTKLSTGKFNFTLDESVTVASASTGSNFETTPGTADGSVTAVEIGPDSNLAKDTDLIIESFAKETYVARSTQAFTGGASREILAVSKEDRDTLLANLRKELLDKAAQEFKTDSNGGRFMVPTLKTKVTKSTFNAEVGKETSEVTLNMTLQVEALAYLNSELKPLVNSILSAELPAGYALSEEDPQILSAPVQTSSASAQIILQTSLSSLARPQLDTAQLQQELAGKSEAQAKEILGSKAEIKSAEMVVHPRLLFAVFKMMPKKPSTISLEFKD